MWKSDDSGSSLYLDNNLTSWVSAAASVNILGGAGVGIRRGLTSWVLGFHPTQVHCAFMSRQNTLPQD